MRSSHRKFAGLLLATSLVVAACGSDDDDSGSTSAPDATVEQDESPDATDAPDDAPDATTAPEPTLPPTPPGSECGVLVAAVAEDFDVLDPQIAAGETPATWLSLIYETIVGVDQFANPTAGLATDWTISDDGLTYTFNLRDGVLFSNGEPFDSSIVKWNLERIINPDTAASSQSLLSVIDSIDTPDPLTLVLNLSEPNAPLISALSQQGRAGMMHPDAVDDTNTLVTHIGTGPFTYVSYAAGDRLVLDANPNYWDGAPLLEGIEVRLIPDGTSRLNALDVGDIDFGWAVPAEDATTLAENGNFVLQENVQNRGNFFSININTPPFDNPKLREAMNLAVSRSDIVAAGWNGFAVETSQPYNENSFWYMDKELRKDADLEAARAIVQENGFEGTPVTIVQWEALGSDNEAQIVASAWNDIGLDATIEKVGGADLISRSEELDFDVIYLYISLITDPTRAYNYLLESTATRNGISGGVQSEEMDAFLSAATQSSDPDERKDLYSQVLDLNYDLEAMFYTVRPIQFVGIGTDVTGFQMGVYNVKYVGEGSITNTCVPADG
jgi:peptide/nickel transport system substrate-binding protein